MSTPIFIPEQSGTITTEIQTALDAKLNKKSKTSLRPIPNPVLAPAGTPNRICPYLLIGNNTNTLSLSTVAPRADFYRFTFEDAMNIKRLGTQCTVAGTGTVEVGIYYDNNGRPGNLLYTTGAMSCATTGFKETTGLNIDLAANTDYWLAVCYVFTSGTPGIKNINNGIGCPVIQGITESSTTTSTNYAVVGLAQNSVTALPATANAGNIVSSYAAYLHLAIN